MLTLGQSALATGLSKPTIQRAIKGGRISATKNDDGSYSIDPSELHRVFPPVTDTITGSVKQSGTPILNSALQHGFNALHELVDNLKDERDDLRKGLDRSEAARANDAEELRRLTMLLTHRHEVEPAQTEQKAESLLWKKLFGRN